MDFGFHATGITRCVDEWHDSSGVQSADSWTALDVIFFVAQMPRTNVSRHIGAQLLRCGTSQASNYRASCRARSNADFIAKMGIVEEELDETLFWLEMLLSSREAVPLDKVNTMSSEADELLAMPLQSIRTARGGSR